MQDTGRTGGNRRLRFWTTAATLNKQLLLLPVLTSRCYLVCGKSKRALEVRRWGMRPGFTICNLHGKLVCFLNCKME